MKAIRFREPGGPEVLELIDLPEPTPGEGECLIAVEAAGLNRPDVFQRLGFYPPPPGAPETPGLEVAGRVIKLGPGVEGVREGDAVCALVPGGGYAEQCVAPASLVLPVPEGWSMAEAASLPETFFTVWFNVFQTGGLLDGERLLVHGGSSGIGAAAIQLAKAFGAEVFTTAGSAAKCAFCTDLGADHAINYKTEDFVSVVKDRTDGRGVDVVLDMVGGSYLARNIKCMARKGVHASIAFLGGSKAELDFMPVMLKQLTLTGSTLRPQPLTVKSAISAELREQVWPRLANRQIRATIDSTFPLADAKAAHARLDGGAHCGKIMLTI
ncbi:MAG: NAD(P)H-quinone oxidoreductase [Pseudomonadota bacterium]